MTLSVNVLYLLLGLVMLVAVLIVDFGTQEKGLKLFLSVAAGFALVAIPAMNILFVKKTKMAAKAALAR